MRDQIYEIFIGYDFLEVFFKLKIHIYNLLAGSSLILLIGFIEGV